MKLYYYERSGNMVKNYDAIVIGAGNGGLVASARLAKEGKNFEEILKYYYNGCKIEEFN